MTKALTWIGDCKKEKQSPVHGLSGSKTIVFRLALGQLAWPNVDSMDVGLHNTILALGLIMYPQESSPNAPRSYIINPPQTRPDPFLVTLISCQFQATQPSRLF
jgi:hypothetical protein